MRIIALIILLVLPVGMCYAQKQDSLRVEKDTLEVIKNDFSDMLVPIDGQQPIVDHSSISDLGTRPSLEIPTMYLPQVNWYGMPKKKSWQQWATGYFYGGHNYAAELLYGYVARTQFGVQQEFGNHWSANASVSLQKNSVYFNTVGVGGSVTYQPVDWFAVTAFGYYSPGSFMSAYQVGPQYNWGGFFTFQTEHVGIDLGARQTYDPFSGREVTPIIMPYYRMGKAKLGIDIGPLIKSLIDKNSHSEFDIGPIPRPIKAMPPIAPRR